MVASAHLAYRIIRFRICSISFNANRILYKGPPRIFHSSRENYWSFDAFLNPTYLSSIRLIGSKFYDRWGQNFESYLLNYRNLWFSILQRSAWTTYELKDSPAYLLFTPKYNPMHANEGSNTISFFRPIYLSNSLQLAYFPQFKFSGISWNRIFLRMFESMYHYRNSNGREYCDDGLQFVSTQSIPMK